MTTHQIKKDPAFQSGGISATRSKIPIRCRRRPPFSTDKHCAQDQENQDPRRLVQKLSTQRTPRDSAYPRPKASLHQTKKSERLVGSPQFRNPQFRNPLEELKPSPAGQDVGPGPPLQSEASGAIEFVPDPAALATILSGEGLKSCHLGRHTSLAQRILVRGKQKDANRGGQGIRASAYLAPRTPTQRLEGSGLRSQTLCSQRLEELNKILSSGASLHPSTRPSSQELRRETGGISRIAASQASGLFLDSPVQPAPSLPGREHEVVTHSDEGGGDPLTLAQRVPLRETQEKTHMRDSCDAHLMFTPRRVMPSSITHPLSFGRAQRIPSPSSSVQTSYSVLQRLAIRPKTQFTPIPSIYRVQKSQTKKLLSSLSPQPGPEEPALPWEQITVQLFNQENRNLLQEGTGKPYGASPSNAFNFKELKMQRITILQQLLQQEVQGLAESKCAPSSGGSTPPEVFELQPLLAEIARILDTPEHHSGTSHLPRLLDHTDSQKPCPPEECEQPQPGLRTEPEVAQPCPPEEPGPKESTDWRELELIGPSAHEQPNAAEPGPLQAEPAPLQACTQRQAGLTEHEQPNAAEPGSLQAEPAPLQACTQGQAGLTEPSSEVACGASETHSLEPRIPGSNPQPGCHQGAPVTTSLLFQSPLGASSSSYTDQSLRPPMGQAGPRRLAPRTLALRQRLQACLSAIHGFHEARLDDECAFYTSRAPLPGPSRICANPVATLLEWQDALSFIPVGSAASQDSPS